jgi:hypothetical protein
MRDGSQICRKYILPIELRVESFHSHQESGEGPPGPIPRWEWWTHQTRNWILDMGWQSMTVAMSVVVVAWHSLCAVLNPVAPKPDRKRQLDASSCPDRVCDPIRKGRRLGEFCSSRASLGSGHDDLESNSKLLDCGSKTRFGRVHVRPPVLGLAMAVRGRRPRTAEFSS